MKDSSPSPSRARSRTFVPRLLGVLCSGHFPLARSAGVRDDDANTSERPMRAGRFPRPGVTSHRRPGLVTQARVMSPDHSQRRRGSGELQRARRSPLRAVCKEFRRTKLTSYRLSEQMFLRCRAPRPGRTRPPHATLKTTMTIEERLERLAERHEGVTQAVELMAAENREGDKRWDRIEKLIGDMAEGITRLLHVAEIHEQRISRLEDQH
jgi:hypothetical protein